MSREPRAYDRAVAVVMADPGRTLHVREIASRARCCKRIAEEAIADLLADGRIVRRSPAGRASQRPRIIEMIAAGHTNPEIAAACGVTAIYVSSVRTEERERARASKGTSPCI